MHEDNYNKKKFSEDMNNHTLEVEDAEVNLEEETVSLSEEKVMGMFCNLWDALSPYANVIVQLSHTMSHNIEQIHPDLLVLIIKGNLN